MIREFISRFRNGKNLQKEKPENINIHEYVVSRQKREKQYKSAIDEYKVQALADDKKEQEDFLEAQRVLAESYFAPFFESLSEHYADIEATETKMVGNIDSYYAQKQITALFKNSRMYNLRADVSVFTFRLEGNKLQLAIEYCTSQNNLPSKGPYNKAFVSCSVSIDRKGYQNKILRFMAEHILISERWRN